MARPKLVMRPVSGPLFQRDGSIRLYGYEAARPISTRPRTHYHSLLRGFDYVLPGGYSKALPPKPSKPRSGKPRTRS